MPVVDGWFLVWIDNRCDNAPSLVSNLPVFVRQFRISNNFCPRILCNLDEPPGYQSLLNVRHALELREADIGKDLDGESNRIIAIEP